MKKLLIAIIALSTLFPSSVWGAIAFDDSSLDPWANTGSSVTWSHTCTGSDLVLIVHAFTTAASPPTGVTYNGTAMTMVDEEDSYTGNNNNSSLWYLVDPDTGANNIVATFSGSVNSALSAASYTGVDTTDVPHVGYASGPGRNTATTDVVDTIVTTTDGAWLVSGAYAVDATRETGSMVVRESSFNITVFYDLGPLSAGSNSMTWNNGGSSFRFASHITMAIAPTGGTPAAIPKILFFK